MDLRSNGPGTGDARDAAAQRERRLNQLIDLLPKSWRSTTRWLRHPSQRWLRICVGCSADRRQPFEYPSAVRVVDAPVRLGAAGRRRTRAAAVTRSYS